VPIEPKSLADFNATMVQFSKEIGGDVEMIAREQMHLMCRDAMTFTPPMPKGGGRGLTAAAHKAGMNKLANDVRRIFVAQDEPVRGRTVFLRKVISAVRTNNSQAFYEIHQDVTPGKVKALSPVMQKIMEDTNWRRAQAKAKNYLNKSVVRENLKESNQFTVDLRKLHDQAKGAVGGRWPKNAKYKGPQYLVPNTIFLNAYIAERQFKVGRVKAGWSAAKMLIPQPVNKRGNPYNRGVYEAPWVDANRAGMGTFNASRSGQSVSMTIANMIGNINNVADEAQTENIVYGNRVKQMAAAIQSRIEKTAAAANRKK
jgi:hypothetical protein